MITVVIPIYNKVPHLERAVKSVLIQNEADWELILVDDGSTDGSYELAERLKGQDDRISLYLRDRPGPGGYAARNMGIEKASGEWVAFLDADDEWQPGFLKEISRMAVKYPKAGFLSTSYHVQRGNEILRESRYGAKFSTRGDHSLSLSAILRNIGKQRWPVHTSSAVAKRDALLACGGFPEGRCKRGGDRDTWLRLFLTVPYAWSPFIGASYFVDSVNMVTKTVTHSPSPCSRETLKEAIEGQKSIRKISLYQKALLMKIYNLTLTSYIRQEYKKGELDRTVFSLLYPLAAPVLTMKVMAFLFLQPLKRQTR